MLLHRSLLLLAIYLLMATSILAGQDTARLAGVGLETRLLTGKVFKHEEKFTLPIPKVTMGLDVNLTRRTNGAKQWEAWRRYPRIGIAAAVFRYGIDSVYGTSFGIYPNVTLPLLVYNNFEWTLRLGNGIGYVTERFSRVPPVNTVNVAIGTHLVDFIVFNSEAVYRPSPHWELSAGIFVHHISSGSFRKPNLGVNAVGISTGVSWFPVTATPTRLPNVAPLPRPRTLLQLRYGMTLVSAYTPRGPLYPVYSGTAYASRRYGRNNKFFAGADYSYHQNLYSYLKFNNLHAGSENRMATKTSILVGDEFIIGRVGILMQLGAYLHKGYGQHADVYQKIAGNYYLIQQERGPIKELFVFTALKTHLNVAELGEIGIGLGL
jgi:hypothetical protein